MRGISIRRPLIRTDGGEIRRGELYLDLMLRYPQRVHAWSTRPRKQRSGCRCGCPLRVKSCYDRYAPKAVIRSLAPECPPQSGHSAAPKTAARCPPFRLYADAVRDTGPIRENRSGPMGSRSYFSLMVMICIVVLPTFFS